MSTKRCPGFRTQSSLMTRKAWCYVHTYIATHWMVGIYLYILLICMYCISLLQLSINECVLAYNCRCVSHKGLGQRIDFGQRVVLVLLKLMILIWMWVRLEPCPLFVWSPDSVDYFTVYEIPRLKVRVTFRGRLVACVPLVWCLYH